MQPSGKSNASESPIAKQQMARLRARIKQARCEHQYKLRKQLNEKDINVNEFEQRLNESLDKVEQLKQNTPKLTFASTLPVSERRKEIADLIEKNQVVIIAGETGSGKTTQIPKICLSLGLGNKGLIAHTQPRRIAARTVADRIASELQTPLGDTVGYQVRFDDVSSNNTRIKLMTDGVLLAELQRDQFLSRYEVVIIDEAHERSLNIDFLLGLLKRLCSKRPDLKVIVTSATIDLQKFAEHFSLQGKPAPIIEVSGRTYPVEVIYQPPPDPTHSLPDVITDTVQTIIRNEAKGLYKANGDILVFCAGEREIRDASHALRKAQLQLEVLPLYSRLSVKEQNRVFQSAQHRKVVLATNVAETSITVPGITYVIDPGLARISRYSFRSKVQRLPIEAISQASANQRMGRCGRVANGVCIRLYSEDDFAARADYTPAEILRSNLAAVILKMLRMKVRDIGLFDFIDQPDTRLLNDGFKLLEELGAIQKNKNSDRRLTHIGRQMSDLPVDPRYARILVAAEQNGSLRDALIVVSALSIQDPRERPVEKQQAADQAHRSIAHPQSDFFSYLYLWQAINNERASLSNTKFKQRCIERYWSIARVFEWRELHRQLHGISKTLNWKLEPWVDLSLPDRADKKTKPKKSHFDARYEKLHKSLLSGLLSHIARIEPDGQYLAARGRHVQLFPGSVQHKQKPNWVMAAEFLETSKLFAHTIATIKPQWAISCSQHLCRYSYSAPSYRARSGAVSALRKTLLFGLTLRDKETVNYGSINPRESRKIFIQQALVEQHYIPPSKTKDKRKSSCRANQRPTAPSAEHFLLHNQRLIHDIETLENKTRRRNLLVNDEFIYDFYDERLPMNINNRKSLETWINVDNQNLLKLSKEQLLAQTIDQTEVAQFPDTLSVNGKDIAVSYKFRPGEFNDGVTLTIPVTLLEHFPANIGDWLVPGLLREKCIALIKTLPKQIRRHYAPAADSIDRIYKQLQADNTQLTQCLGNLLGDNIGRSKGAIIKITDWDLTKLDPYYLMNYKIIDVDGSLIEQGRDLNRLKLEYADSVALSINTTDVPQRQKLEKHRIKTWDFGTLEKSVTYEHQGMTITAYPMLKIRRDKSVSLLASDKPTLANYHSNNAILHLAITILSGGTHRQSYNYLKKELLRSHNKPRDTETARGKQYKNTGLSALARQLKKAGPNEDYRDVWLEELILAALKESCFTHGLSNIRNQSSFNDALDSGVKNWVATAMKLEPMLMSALQTRDEILADLTKIEHVTIQLSALELDQSIEDIKAQIYRLFDPHFLRHTTSAELKQYSRYLKAIQSRLDKLSNAPKLSAQTKSLFNYQEKLNNLISNTLDRFSANKFTATNRLGLGFVYTTDPKIKYFSIMLEEWRVSLYAQNLKTQFPISEKRIARAWLDLNDEKFNLS